MLTLACGNNKHYRQVSGFTLLEVLLVLIIGGLLMGVVATSLSQGPILRNGSREIAASLRQARAAAVIRQQTLVWKMDVQAKQYGLDGVEGEKQRTFNSLLEAKLHTAASEVDSVGKGGIRFYPDGSSTGGDVEMSYQQQSYKINVEWVTGRVSIQ